MHHVIRWESFSNLSGHVPQFLRQKAAHQWRGGQFFLLTQVLTACDCPTASDLLFAACLLTGKRRSDLFIRHGKHVEARECTPPSPDRED
jgi:hypothetical protein